MATVLVISLVCIVAAAFWGSKSSVAYKKACIEKKANRLGYDLTFDK